MFVLLHKALLFFIYFSNQVEQKHEDHKVHNLSLGVSSANAAIYDEAMEDNVGIY